MGFSDEERRRNHEALASQINRDVDNFLVSMDFDQSSGFTEDEFAAAINNDRIDRRAATQMLISLKDQGRVHYLGGRWHSGPMPPEPSPIDQA
jgi:hypothetical protein